MMNELRKAIDRAIWIHHPTVDAVNKEAIEDILDAVIAALPDANPDLVTEMTYKGKLLAILQDAKEPEE